MRSRIGQWAVIGVLGMGISLGALAIGPGDAPGRPAPPDPNGPGVPSSPLNSRDEVRQTEPPRPGYYQDIPRRPGDYRRWEAGGPGQRPGGDWHGRPDGHGDGWGPGPQYRPGYTTDRFPDRYRRVPYRGQDYYYSGGYWYRPHGGDYIVVRPPYGLRVDALPSYAQEVWLSGLLYFLVADTYYQYQPDRQDYVVVNPTAPAYAPPPEPQPGGGYDVIAYPANGQGPQQQEQDRYHCHRWAVSQSGFDPATASSAPPPGVANDYRRSLAACLSGRGYSVN
ncbi:MULTISPECIES: DUF6515 family protein [Pseudomonas]|uniref:DUF6515 family protein n=1 Tax=Pseudomonas TaxID=286 RepID=UPI000541278A|nr:DUF6515 family protein [Pseudomonas parafulva]AIZ34295.1 hypothetical protein NJ69_15500 [Pseudomonas parafulva]